MKSIRSIRKEFPLLSRAIHGKPLAYLDNASTTQKPRVVLDALQRYYATTNANIHRGIHRLSEESTELYEGTRKKVAQFINARSASEIIFTKSCTESINLVAAAWGGVHVKKGDEIIVSIFEHHSNLVPWQELARRTRARLRIVPFTRERAFDMDAYVRMLSKKTKLVCVTAQSNVLGVMPPLKKIIKSAHAVRARVLVDGAQSVGHAPTSVHGLDCDFFAFSAHKMLGPTGVGILYGKQEVLEAMPPFLFGGDMVTTVTQKKALFREVPWRFEAGTPNIADVIAFGPAIDFLTNIGLENIEKYDKTLLSYAERMLLSFPQVTLFTPTGVYNSILSFTLHGVHPHDIAAIFNAEGIAVRSGLHCAEPLVRKLGVSATTRMSFYFYNTCEEIDRAITALRKVIKTFKV